MPLRCLLLLILALSTAQAVDFTPLEKVPVQDTGRKKPYLVFAEETAMGLSGKTSIPVDDKKMGAMEAITTIWLQPAGWDTKPIILVNHKGLKEALGLPVTQKLFSYQELVANPKLLLLLREAQTLRMRPGNERLSGLPKEAADVGARLSEFESLVNGSAFRVIANPESAGAAWQPAPDATLLPLAEALRLNDNAAFLKTSEALKQSWAKESPAFQPPAWKMDLEVIYQKAHPFRWAWICYAGAGLLLAFFFRSRPAYTVAWILALCGLLFQIWGFATRVIIGGRAPVTNMYESVVWVAFGIVFFALIFEAIYRSRYFLLGATPLAVVSLILADTQTVALDRSIHPLVPVLRDNFWLTTHVLTITLSYAAFALALGLGHLILGTIIAGRKPSNALYNYLYRAIQVGVLLIAIGTILGGVWANYSWGRFWGWDPKETWALITLLGYLIILHGRIAGKWGGFGLAIGSVAAFLGVLMAWYGVNFVLGVGLHSYGFGSGGFGWAFGFVLLELVFLAVAVKRNRDLKPKPAAPTPVELISSSR